MLPSLALKMGLPTIADTGLPQQVELFRDVQARTGTTPPVIDTEDVLKDPRGVLQRFCAAVDIAFDERMLHWPAGGRETDGIWAKYWYDAVERSTGFEPYAPRPRNVTPELEPVLAECLPYYDALAAHRLRA
jgi:hypothetical protein